MTSFIHQSWHIGSLQLPNRLIQGPLAGYSCAPFRALFAQFHYPAYCVSEMMSAYDVVHKDRPGSRFLYRSDKEPRLACQIAGQDPVLMADAAQKLAEWGADLIDINCGCPKRKIRKKGAGSALLDEPAKLLRIVQSVKQALTIPLSVKIRLHGPDHSLRLAQAIAEAGADALIVHGRSVADDYAQACRWQAIAAIKQQLSIPVIANGDIACAQSLQHCIAQTACDGYMIGRAGTGKPWLYQSLLTGQPGEVNLPQRITLFLEHIDGLACLESEHKALLQSRSLLKYYFRTILSDTAILQAMQAANIVQLQQTMMRFIENSCTI
ncbi:MAG: tRNA-dihydrouridine synthase family protein [Legionellaceae bacterium]|nr:tRNA-dihydrouridine synthase family protein [Legionellaceae bacterium]